MWNGEAFSGTKIALICDGCVLAYLRDAKPEIPFPNMWDLPGGGREGSESPVECVIREVMEEFGLVIAESRVHSLERRRSALPHGLDNYFCVAELSRAEIKDITFGDEGQRWTMMPIAEFLQHESAVPHLQDGLRAHCGP